MWRLTGEAGLFHPVEGVFYFISTNNYGSNHTGGRGIAKFDSDRQTLTQGLNFSQETRPKTKFFSLLIYAGYPA